MRFSGKSIANLTKVSLDITKHLFSKKEFERKNIVFSPLSIQTVLSIVTAGSEGPTQKQLLSFLRSKSTTHLNSLSSHLVSSVLSDAAPAGGPRLSYVNGAWVEQTLSVYPSFKEILVTDYKATLTPVDFINKAIEVGEEVNLWAAKQTNDLIQSIINPTSLHSLTRLIFANALYLKGDWDQKFNASKTKDYDFHLLDGSSIKVPFMTNWNKQYLSVFDGFKVLRLPYKQGKDKRQFSMYFFLPDAKDGLKALIEKLTYEYEFLEQTLPRRKVKVGDFRIPKFNISFAVETSSLLKELGVVLPFLPGGLTKMVNSPMWINGIFHKAFIEVNEEGTKAAAVTIAISHGSMPGCTSDFVADHPFLFMIREDLTGTILFIGQMLNPLDK